MHETILEFSLQQHTPHPRRKPVKLAADTNASSDYYTINTAQTTGYDQAFAVEYAGMPSDVKIWGCRDDYDGKYPHWMVTPP